MMMGELSRHVNSEACRGLIIHVLFSEGGWERICGSGLSIPDSPFCGLNSPEG